MKKSDLDNVFAMMGINNLPEPNHSGWLHIACPMAPWKHKHGVDRSEGFAIKVEENGISAYSCPVCKSHGRIENLARELGVLRKQNYETVVAECRKIEMLGMSSLPPWEQRNLTPQVEQLPEPLDPDVYDPESIFDSIYDHPDAIAYLEARRVLDRGVAHAEIRFDPDTSRLVFPVKDKDGNLYAFTGRTILPPERMEYWSQQYQRMIKVPKVKDYANLPKRLLILGEHRWTIEKPIVLVEGLFAYARFMQEGVDDHFNVGALLGSAVTPGKAAILRNWMRPTYLFLDPDDAGDAGIFGQMKKTGRFDYGGNEITERDPTTGAVWALAEHMPVFVPPYPDGVHDPDDLTLQQVISACSNLLPMAKPKI